MIDELAVLRTAWGHDEVPAPDTEAAARGRLLARAQPDAGPASARAAARWRTGRRPARLRLGWRIGLAAALAAAVGAGLVVAEGLGGVDRDGSPAPLFPGLPAPQAAAADVLEDAAVAAEGRTFVPPRRDQWLYVELRSSSQGGPGGVATGGPLTTRTSREWGSADGSRWAFMENGTLRVQSTTGGYPASGYFPLAHLPTDPDALLKWLSDTSHGAYRDATPQQRAAGAFQDLNTILRDNLLPPRIEAAMFRTIARIPGVTLVRDAVNVDGRPAFALGLLAEGWLHEEILLDRTTYDLIGERSIAVKDHTAEALDGKWTVPAGTIQLLMVRTVAKYVDHAGDT